MGTWNTRGLRGSTLEDLINRTNEQLQGEKACPDTENTHAHHTDHRLISPAGTSLWLILTRRVPWTISEWFRGFPYALMPRNAVHLLFLCRTSMLTRSVLWRSLRLRVGIAFIVLYYTGMDEIYYVPFRTIKHFWDRMEAGGARALP